VTLVAKDVPMSVYLGSEEQALELFREYAEEVHHATPAGTEAVVLPEKIGRVSESGISGGGHSLFFDCDCYTCGDCPGLGSENAICCLQFLPLLFA